MKYLVVFLSCALAALGATAPGRYIVELTGDPATPRASSRLGALARQHTNARQAIQQQGAEVTGETTTVTNTLFVQVPAGSTADLTTIPGVKRVYPERIRKALLDHALPLEKVPDAWTQIGGMNNAGAGIKIALIDTGIDVNHPGFSDTSLVVPAGFPKTNQDADAAYTNNKIIVARSYTDTPRTPYNADDKIGHGTGVAMVAGGVTTAGTYGIITGVAPKAFLGNYKVFPDGGTGAPDSLILKAIDDAVADGMDVINLSLGSTPAPRPQDDILVQAVENAVNSGVIVTIAAGNDGNDPGTIGSPGIAPDAISVGSTSNDRTFAGTVQADGDNPMQAIPGSGPNAASPITATLVDVSQFDSSGLACGTLPAGSLSGSVVLILRGVCTFEQKIGAAAQAGAIAALIYTDAARPDPISMAVGASNLPATMVGYADGSALKQQLASGPINVTLDFSLTAYGMDPNRLSTFSSVGPNSDGSIKPDLLAIGGTVSTAQPLSMNGGFVVESGTSFSSPTLAGAAALLKAARPGLTTQQYRSLLINSAAPFSFSSGALSSVQQTGTGLLNMLAALNNSATASPVSLSFGAGGSTVDQTTILNITNVGSVPDTFSLTAMPSSSLGVIPAISPNNVTLGPGETAAIAVEFAASGLGSGAYEGTVQVQSTQSPVTSLIPYSYAVPSNTPAYLTVLNPPTSATHGTRQTVFFRISDASGLPLFMDAKITATSGGGSVVAIQSADSTYPGVYAATVRLGQSVGNNVFHIAIGGLTKDVTIPGN